MDRMIDEGADQMIGNPGDIAAKDDPVMQSQALR